MFFFFKKKTAYEMRISDWSSDVCSSDLSYGFGLAGIGMIAGLIVFVLGKRVLLGAGEAPAPLGRSTEISVYGVGIVAVAVMWALVQYQDVIQNLLLISGTLLLVYSTEERREGKEGVSTCSSWWPTSH